MKKKKYCVWCKHQTLSPVCDKCTEGDLWKNVAFTYFLATFFFAIGLAGVLLGTVFFSSPESLDVLGKFLFPDK